MDHCDLRALESSLLSHVPSSIGMGFCGADFNTELVNLFEANTNQYTKCKKYFQFGTGLKKIILTLF